MNTFTVTWTIDITADSAKEAAEEALKIQRDSSSETTVFTVYDHKSSAEDMIDVE